MAGQTFMEHETTVSRYFHLKNELLIIMVRRDPLIDILSVI